MKKVCLMSGVLALTLVGCSVPGVRDFSSENSKGAAAEVATAELPIYRIYSDYNNEKYYGEKELPEDYKGPRPFEIYHQCNEELLLTDAYKEQYPELYTTLMAQAQAHKNEYAQTKESMSAEALESFENHLDGGIFDDFSKYESSEYVTVARSDANVLSAMTMSYLNMGGGSGCQYAQGGHTYDVNTGKELSLSDIVTASDDDFRKIIKTELEELMGSDYHWGVDLDASLAQYSITPAEDGYNYKWYLDYDGLNVIFNQYEIGGFDEGVFKVVLDYKDNSKIFNSKYTSNIPTSYITCEDVSVGGVRFAGHESDYSLSYDIKSPECGENLTLHYGDKSAPTDMMLYDDPHAIKCYRVVPGNGKEYLYVAVPFFIDPTPVAVFDITNDNVAFVGDFTYCPGEIDHKVKYDEDFGGDACFTYPDRFMMGLSGYGLGSYTYSPEFKVGDDGMPVQTTETGVVGLGSHEAVLKKDMTFDVVDENGNVISQNEKFAAGTSFDLIKADDGATAYCRVEDGRIVKITVEGDGRTIGGESVDDVFDNLMYGDF